jgi:hypothetical protein
MAFQAVRMLPGEEPPSRALHHLVAGLALGGVAFALGRSSHRKANRILLGLHLGLLGFVLGSVGALLAFFWTATDHVVAHRNLNLLFCPPFALLLLPFAMLAASGKPRWARLLALTLLACALSATLGVLALPFAAQDSTRIACLTVPLFWLSYLGQRTRPLFSGFDVALRRLLPRPE